MTQRIHNFPFYCALWCYLLSYPCLCRRHEKLWEALSFHKWKDWECGGLALTCLAVNKFVRGTCKVAACGNPEEENPPAAHEKSSGKSCWEIFVWLKHPLSILKFRGGTQTHTTLQYPCCERLRDFETFLPDNLEVLHVPGFPSAPERWGTSICTVRHPKPGWHSATPHSSKPCAHLTPQQHKILNLTAPVLIIWHFLWIFTSPWVR